MSLCSCGFIIWLRFRLFPWRNWSKAGFRTISTSSSGLRSSTMPITTVGSTTRWKPGRARMPSPHPTPESRSSTCQRSPTTQPAPPLQVCTTFCRLSIILSFFLLQVRKIKPCVCCRSVKVELHNSQVFDTNIQTIVGQKDPRSIDSCPRREGTGSTGHASHWAGTS